MHTRYSQTICHLHVEQTTIPYCLQRSSRRRSMAILIKEDGQVKVYAPKSIPEDKIKHFVYQKSAWIIDGVQRISGRSSGFQKPAYEEDSEFLFLGERHPLGFFFSKGTVPSGKPELIRQALENWYRDQAKEFLAGRVLQWARSMDLEVNEIHVRTQKRLWGCCYPAKKKIHLNWCIIMAPVEAIDYVIVHELCHLFEANHSPRFWKRVAEFYPDYLVQKRWFKDHSHELRM